MVQSYSSDKANVHPHLMMVSWAHNSPDPKQQLYRFSRCCTAHGRKSLYLIGHPFALKAAPTYGGSGPHLIHGSETHPLSIPNGILINSTVFLHSSRRSPYTLQWAVPLPPQNCPFTWGIWTPSNIWFPGPTRSPQTKQHLDRFSRFCKAQGHDRQTDRSHYSVCSNKLYSVLNTQYWDVA